MWSRMTTVVWMPLHRSISNWLKQQVRLVPDFFQSPHRYQEEEEIGNPDRN